MIFLSVLLCTFIIYACNKSDIFEKKDIDNSSISTNNKNASKSTSSKYRLSDINISFESNSLISNYQSGNFSITYEAKIINSSITKTSLKIQDNETGNGADISYVVDSKQKAYKLIQHEQVINEAKKALPSFNELNIEEILVIYEKFGRLLVDDNNIKQVPEFVESIFYQNAILNTIGRSKNDKKACNCTPYQAYFVGKSNFWCQEDYYISPNDIIEKVKSSNYKLNKQETEVYKYLELNKNKAKISIDNLTFITISKEKFDKTVKDYYNKVNEKKANARIDLLDCNDCFFGVCGNQLGCCGNYSGCCWLATWDCFIHDIACLNCDHWHCGPGCKPGMG